MNNYRYGFDKSSKKFICPGCGKKRYVRYMDFKTMEYLPYEFGKCDREVKCPYDNPYKPEKQASLFSGGFYPRKRERTPVSDIYIPEDEFAKTLKGYNNSPFYINLIKHGYSQEDIAKVIELYGIGTYPFRNQLAATFPLIDYEGRIAFIQVKAFDEKNHGLGHPNHFISLELHKGRKDKWLEDYMQQEEKMRCFFGEHLLKRFPKNPIALVEAPKTAIYCTLHFGLPETEDDFIWLAAMSLGGFKFSNLTHFTNRNIELFPDLSKDGSTFIKWEEIAQSFQRLIKGLTINMNRFLEENASEELKEAGGDLADYLCEYM